MQGREEWRLNQEIIEGKREQTSCSTGIGLHTCTIYHHKANYRKPLKLFKGKENIFWRKQFVYVVLEQTSHNMYYHHSSKLLPLRGEKYFWEIILAGKREQTLSSV